MKSRIVSNRSNQPRKAMFICTSGANGEMICNERPLAETGDCPPPISMTCPADTHLPGCNTSPETIAQLLNPANVQVSTTCTETKPGFSLGQVKVTYQDIITKNGCYTTVTRVFVAEDACGNTATCDQSVTYRTDTEGPIITLNGTGGNLGCNPSEADINTALGGGTYRDACECEEHPLDSYNDEDSHSGCGYARTRFFSVRDECGNTASASITVTWTQDNEPPVITVIGNPEDGQLGCNPTPGQIDAGLGQIDTSTDNCGSVDITVVTSPPEIVGKCGWKQTRTWNAIDACGNHAQEVSRTVYWKEDSEPPVFDCPTPQETIPVHRIVEDCGQGIVWTQPPVSDNCGGDVTVTYEDTISTITVHCRTWIATDSCGKSSTCKECVAVVPCTAYKGCSQGFWGNTTEIWDSMSDPIAGKAGFYTGTNFYTYFSIPPGTAGLPSPLTMGGAIGLGGGNCFNLARQGVAALLNAAEFTTSYNYPAGATDLASLKALIRTTLLSGNCTSLASFLDTSNNHEENGVCEALKPKPAPKPKPKASHITRTTPPKVATHAAPKVATRTPKVAATKFVPRKR
jgi:hypothetical protein